MITADELRKRAALESVVRITDEEAEELATVLDVAEVQTSLEAMLREAINGA